MIARLVGALSLSVASSLTAGQSPVVKHQNNNLIVNGDFSAGSDRWFLWHDTSAKASFDTKENIGKVAITDPGEQKWSISLVNSGISLEKNHSYSVSFSARSTTNTRLYVSTGMTKEPYWGYSGGYHFYPESALKMFSFTFTMRQDTDHHAGLQFLLGDYGKRTLWLDNISIRDLGIAPALDIRKAFPPPRTKVLKRGIQFGMELASPFEGTHVPALSSEYFDAIEADNRFDHIRIPVWWEHHTQKTAPFAINADFLKRVDWAASESLSRGYPTIINMHWFHALEAQPQENKAELIAVWKQLAEYFNDYPQHLYFDILNEPNGHLDTYWNAYAIELYDMIRAISPQRPIIISGTYWAHMSHLTQLQLPERIKKDPNILIQFHPYVPGDFCFQGSAGNGRENLKQIRWLGTPQEKKQITDLLDNVTRWAKSNGVQLYNGEFTAMSSGESLLEDRLRWIGFIVRESEKRGIPWNYYDFSGDESYVYDTATKEWNKDIMSILFPGRKLRK